MDVRLSAEQQALRAAAARMGERLGPGSVPDLDDAARIARLRAAVDETGWRDLREGADDDRPLASGVEVAIVAEELGRALADVPFAGPTLAAELRRRAALPPADVAETVVFDPTLGSVASVVRTATPAAVPAGVAVDAAGATAALVLVEDGGTDRHRLGRLSVGVDCEQLDLTRRTVAADRDRAVTILDGGRALDADDMAGWLALGLAVTSADLVGVMAGVLGLAREHAVTRRQYDAPIGSFQAVQHLLADAHVAMEGSRSVALHAAWAVDALPAEEALAAAALAKAYCARAARNVCETSVQVHGGFGNTWDCLAHVFLRRALLSIELFGGTEANVDRVLVHRGIGAPAGSGHGLR